MCKYSTTDYQNSLKLLQKSNVRIHEIPEIWYPVLDHDETVESESERKSCVDFWIESSLTDNIRVDKSCPHKFDPTRSLTDFASVSVTKRAREVDLNSWLDEREVPRSHTDRNLFSEDI